MIGLKNLAGEKRDEGLEFLLPHGGWGKETGSTLWRFRGGGYQFELTSKIKKEKELESPTIPRGGKCSEKPSGEITI